MTSFEKRHLRGQFCRICFGKNWYRGCLSFCLHSQGHSHWMYKKCQIFPGCEKKNISYGEAISWEVDGMWGISKFKMKTQPMP